MAEAKEVNGINLDNLNKLVVVDRAYDDDGRNGYWEKEHTTLYEDDSNPRSLRYYVSREYANQCFDDKCVFDVTELVNEIYDNDASTKDPLEEYIDLKTSKEFYEHKSNHFRRTWHDRNWRIMYEGYTEEEYEDMYPERPIEL